MQEHQDRRDYPTVDDPSFSSTLSSGGEAGTAISVLEPYIPLNVPHGLPHVARIASLSSMDLPPEVRLLIILTVRLAEVHGLASAANSTPREICRMGSDSCLSCPMPACGDGLHSGTFVRELRFPGNLRTAGAAAA